MLDQVDWKKGNGLIPAVIQDANKGHVLMLGYMNREALEKTIQERIVTFFSRSKGRLWTKGETSGSFLHVKEYSLDCDKDTILITVEPTGPVCHCHTPSCFSTGYVPFLKTLSDVIDQRFENGGETSYVRKLFSSGQERIAQKVGEEGVEVVIASLREESSRIKEETADLLFHLLVNLRYHKIDFQEIVDVLQQRVKK